MDGFINIEELTDKSWLDLLRNVFQGRIPARQHWSDLWIALAESVPEGSEYHTLTSAKHSLKKGLDTIGETSLDCCLYAQDSAREAESLEDIGC